MTTCFNASKIEKIIRSVKRLAIQYYKATGKPLGVTGEIAEWEAARLLGLELCSAREAGYDGLRLAGPGPKRVQIKGRRLLHTSKPGQRIGTIKLNQLWDSVVLILLDEMYKPVVIYEALRAKIKKALKAPGSKARNLRGALSVSKFKSIAGPPIWKKGSE